MRYPCIESTIEFPWFDFHIRLWINQEEVKEEYPSLMLNNMLVYKDKPTIQELVDYFHKGVKGLNAIQIKKKVEKDVSTGIEFENGIVAFSDYFMV